jgi:hypothetical protein
MTPKGSDLQATDLVEVSTLVGGSYVTKSVTGQDIIDAAAGSGVTDVTATAPIVSTGGTTPNLSMEGANGADDGFLKSTDWNTFNDKQNALTLTTTGTSGPATLIADTLNIPQYSGGGGGGGGIHAIPKPISGRRLSYALGASTTGASFTLARLTLVPFMPANTFTISEILMYCNILGTGSLCRLLIYSDINGFPNAKLYESADLNLSTIGFKIATTTFTFNAGTTYWLGFHGGAVTANVTCNNIAAVYAFSQTGSAVNGVNGYNVTAALGSAPANITTATLNTAPPQWIGLTPA